MINDVLEGTRGRKIDTVQGVLDPGERETAAVEAPLVGGGTLAPAKRGAARAVVQAQRQAAPAIQVAARFQTERGPIDPVFGARAVRSLGQGEIVAFVAEIGIDEVLLIGVERLIKVARQDDIAAQLRDIPPLPAQGVELGHGIGHVDGELRFALEVGAQEHTELQGVGADMARFGFNDQSGPTLLFDQRVRHFLKFAHAMDLVQGVAELSGVESIARANVQLLVDDLVGQARVVLDVDKVDDR